MNEQEFKNRTKELALRVIRLIEALPAQLAAETIGKHLLRSAMSVGAPLMAETAGILAMTVASIKTLRGTASPESKIQNPKSKI